MPINSDQWVRRAGLPALTAEGTAYHIHAHLDIFVNGQRVPVGENIGVSRVTRTLSPLHTHAANGILHIEADAPDDFTLGQFFTQWAVRFNAECIGGYCRPQVPWQVYVNGEVFSDDPSTIRLADRQQIAIVIGRPPPEIPATFDFSDGGGGGTPAE